jgi:hypothetical protein
LLRTAQPLSELNEEWLAGPKISETVKDEKVLSSRRLATVLSLTKQTISSLDKDNSP